MREGRKRSLAKAVTWRAFSTSAVALLVYGFTGHLPLALNIALLDVGLKIVLFFLHERAWDKIDYGREEEDDRRKMDQ